MRKHVIFVVILGAFSIGALIGVLTQNPTQGQNANLVSAIISKVFKADKTSKTSELNGSDCSQVIDGTDFMRCLLIKAEQDTNYARQRYKSSKHSQALKKRLSHKQGNKKVKAQIKYIRSVLHAGKTQDAIALIEQELAEQKLATRTYSEKSKNELQSLLAISYLRLGEQAHCLKQENPKMCILPLSSDATYGWKEGSKKAIQLYKELLQNNPDDLNTRWLLNLASMTIDESLDNIPENWLVNSDYLGANVDSTIGHFNNIAQDTNLDIYALAGSSIFDDFNGDGWLDLLVSSWDIEDQLRLFINQGDNNQGDNNQGDNDFAKNGFSEKTTQANLIGITGGLNMVQADYNNDGCMDVLVLRGAWLKSQGEHPNSLLKNECNEQFSDVTRESGLLSFFPSQTAAWADYDLDGYLDVFIGNENYPSELFHNNGDGTFTNVTSQVGLVVNDFVKGVDWGDINNDKLPDLYLSVHGDHNRLYQNMGEDESGQWRFVDVSKASNVMEPVYSFPTAFFDYDNDGWQDIIVLSYSRYDRPALYKEMFNQNLLKSDPTTVLYRNNKDGTFANVAKELNIDKAVSAMGFNHGDIDNDGYQDVYIGTGSPDFRSVIPNFMFRNNAGKGFVNVTAAGGFGHIQKGHGISFGDFDNDGDQDIYAVMGGAFSGDLFQNTFYQNPGNANHWINISLIGNAANKSALGARIKIIVEENGQQREIYAETGSGGSFGSNPMRNEIGLGNATSINSIEITWPSNSKNQIFRNVALDQHYLITEGDSKIQLFSAALSASLADQ